MQYFYVSFRLKIKRKKALACCVIPAKRGVKPEFRKSRGQ